MAETIVQSRPRCSRSTPTRTSHSRCQCRRPGLCLREFAAFGAGSLAMDWDRAENTLIELGRLGLVRAE
jgi:hypothetical protein